MPRMDRADGLEVLLDRLELAATASRVGRRGIAVLALELRPRRGGPPPPEESAARLTALARQRLRSHVHRADTISVLGPLRFAVLLERAVDGPFAIHVADRLTQAMREPFRLDGSPLELSASVGVAAFPDDGTTAEELLRRALQALEGARNAGGGLVGFCSSASSEAAHRRLAIERALEGVLDREELELHYQPQMDTQEGSLVGVEALLRWTSPRLGRVSPGDFIPLLEATGRIEEVGAWVLARACDQAAAWATAGRPLRVSVNVSARQLEAEGFAARVDEELRRTALDPRLLELELTESVLVANPASTREVLESLRQRGVRVAVDDFGTGYASLAYIRRFPMDTLKIDREFVRGLPVDAENVAITSAIIALAHTLRLEMVAEGVETEAEEEFLHSQRCFVVQGFRHARPMAAPALEAWRRDRPWL